MEGRKVWKVPGQRQGSSNTVKIHAKVAICSCLVNGLLTVVKYSLGEASASLALKADAVHSLANVVSYLSLLTKIPISDRKTKTFPLGLHKIENLDLVSAGVVLLLIVAYLFSRYELKAGLEAVSLSLLADTKHVVTDMLFSLVILVALLGTQLGAPLDRCVAVLVAALVART